MPGQFGTINREPLFSRPAFTLSMSITGIPSVIATMSSIPSADRLQDCIRCKGRRYINYRRIRIDSNSLRHCVENGNGPLEKIAALPRRDSTHKVSAVFHHLLAMKTACRPVMPWQISRVFSSTQIAILLSSESSNRFDYFLSSINHVTCRNKIQSTFFQYLLSEFHVRAARRTATGTVNLIHEPQ